MTPQWIEDNADITGPYNLQPQYFEIIPTAGSNLQIALQILLAPPGILKADDSVSKAIVIVVDTELANSRDHDTLSGVSDDNNFLGFFPS